jgi:hypothetical protein
MHIARRVAFVGLISVLVNSGIVVDRGWGESLPVGASTEPQSCFCLQSSHASLASYLINGSERVSIGAVR